MPTPDSFLTIKRPGRGEYREKGSRFFGLAEGVSTVEEADKMRRKLKKEYHDATHQPFAYRLIDGTERMSDDGEPRGTSGASILTQIQKADLYNIQIVVVRYFGGTKLGKGGLARAFSECAYQTIQAAETKAIQHVEFISLKISPEDVKSVKSIASSFSAQIDSISYDNLTQIRLAVPISKVDKLTEALQRRFGAIIINGGN